jgi:hypothetical protein
LNKAQPILFFPGHDGRETASSRMAEDLTIVSALNVQNKLPKRIQFLLGGGADFGSPFLFLRHETVMLFVSLFGLA